MFYFSIFYIFQHQPDNQNFICSFPFLCLVSPSRFDCARRRYGCARWHGYHDTRTDESYASDDAATLSVIRYAGASVPGPRDASTNANHLPMKIYYKFFFDKKKKDVKQKSNKPQVKKKEKNINKHTYTQRGRDDDAIFIGG